MNLALLDPFRRQIPDRVDATLSLPEAILIRKTKGWKESAQNQGWKAANHVAFNRRGAYIAVGYGNGMVGVYDVLSRTLSSLYKPGDGEEEGQDYSPTLSNSYGHGITSVSWSRRSRTLLAGAAGEAEVRLIDTTHPFGPEECCVGVVAEENKENKENNDEDRCQSPTSESAPSLAPRESSFAIPESKHEHFKKPRKLEIVVMKANSDITPTRPNQRRERDFISPVSRATGKRYPSIIFYLPKPIGSCLQTHPRDTSAGIAALNDGSLVAFWAPLSGWEEEQDGSHPKVRVTNIFHSENQFVTCAAFDPHGDRIYAATRDGNLLGFEVAELFDHFAQGSNRMPMLKPSFTISIPGGSSVWHCIVSRNGQYLLLNSADAAIRLYTTKECWSTPEEVVKPTWVFQDVVSKVKFASCDISGDTEFVVGAANGNDNKYELYVWNTSTGALMDKLTGAPVEIYSVAWHPTRSFLAVAASDGLVDIWGPRINWTSFAPDFQALPSNVEYVEREDEFDIAEEDDGEQHQNEEDEEDDVDVDVVTVEPVPVFASDSEEEDEVFCFSTKVTRRIVV